MTHGGFIELRRHWRQPRRRLRGDVASREFVAFRRAGGRVLAGMHVHTWGVTEAIEGLILSGQQVDPRRLGDPHVPLDEV